MAKSIGIDLGTTNSCIAIANETYAGGISVNSIQAIQFDGNRAPMQDSILPSVLFVDESGKEYVGKIGKELREQAPTRVISNTKRFIGTETVFKAGGKEYFSKDIAAIILKSCKMSMVKYGFKEEDKVTITVPASFNVDQIKDTIDAAKEAGLNNINIIPEPTAALIDLINYQTTIIESDRTIDFSKKKRILVFDLGGGTCDVAVIEVKQEGRKVDFSEIAIGRYDELGGVDFDLKVAKYLLKNFCNKRKIHFEALDKNIKKEMINSLRIFSEKAKEYISANLEFGFNEDINYSQYLMNFYEGEAVEFSIDRKEYDKATKNLYEKSAEAISYDDLLRNKNIVDPIIKTLRSYNISKDSIDLVFLTGGMSKYKTVKEKILEIMNVSEDKVISSPNPLEAVAKGAAIYQHYDTNITKVKENKLSKLINEKDELDTTIEITKVMAGSILVDVSEGLPVTIIQANEPVPCSGVIEGELKTTSPSGVVINMYEGKDANDWQMRLQKSKKAMFKNPVKINTPIDIHYSIDENKYLTMFVKVGNEEIKLEHEII